MKKFLFVLLALSFATPVFAQDAVESAPAAPAAVPAESAEAALAEKAAVDNTKAADPVDRVVAHLTNLNDILTRNMKNTDALLNEFKAYLDKNDKAMRMASKEFREKLEKLKVDEAEAYREVAQRKLTPVMDNLITLLIQLNDVNKEASQKLDSMLKVDARYTYNP